MPGMRHHLVVHTCPVCGRRLSYQRPGEISLGDPVHHCTDGRPVWNDDKAEWYRYKEQWHLILRETVLPLIPTILLLRSPELLRVWMPLVIACYGWLLIRILASVIRMKDPKHLEEMYRVNILSKDEFDTWMQRAWRPKRPSHDE